MIQTSHLTRTYDPRRPRVMTLMMSGRTKRPELRCPPRSTAWPWSIRRLSVPGSGTGPSRRRRGPGPLPTLASSRRVTVSVLYIIDINLVVSLCTDYTPGGELVNWKWSHSGGEIGNLLGTWRGKVEGHVGAPSNCLHSTTGIYAQKHLYQMVAERSSKHSWTILTVLGASWRKKWLYWKKWFLWVILPEGDPPDNMAMRLNPPDLSKCRTYERYRQELKAWQEVTDIPKTKQDIAIALSLPQDSGESGIREKVFDEIELKDLKMGWKFWLIFLTKLLVKMISVIAWKNLKILKTTVVDKMRQFWIIYQDLIRNITDSRS